MFFCACVTQMSLNLSVFFQRMHFCAVCLISSSSRSVFNEIIHGSFHWSLQYIITRKYILCFYFLLKLYGSTVSFSKPNIFDYLSNWKSNTYPVWLKAPSQHCWVNPARMESEYQEAAQPIV